MNLSATVVLTNEQIDTIVERVLARLDASAVRGDAPEYLSVKDAANYIGATEGRVRKLVERKRIPVSQDGPGCRVFISRTDLDRFMHDNRNGRRPQ